MDFAALCDAIGLPAEMTGTLQSTDTGLTETETNAYIARLTCGAEYAAAADELKIRLAGDVHGYKMLRIMLLAALRTEILYEQAGISHEIFVDTMRCFSRFANEHRESYGAYGFDRGFWVGRQLSCLLFRIGSLEYERVTYEDKPALSVHIPSDADLEPARVADSFARSRDFFKQTYPECDGGIVYCYSWLLSPALPCLLSEESKIVRFQRLFRIVKWDEHESGYKQWVFKDKSLAPEDFPEQTSLQRNMKRFVLGGGEIGEAFGILIE